MDERKRQVERWAPTEHELREALAAVTDELPDATAEVEEYLDHNELGLAFETLVYELDRLSVRPPEQAVEHLRSAIERMGASSFEPQCREAWERVQLLSRR